MLGTVATVEPPAYESMKRATFTNTGLGLYHRPIMLFRIFRRLTDLLRAGKLPVVSEQSTVVAFCTSREDMTGVMIADLRCYTKCRN